MFTEDQKREYIRLTETTELNRREIAKALGLSYNTLLVYEAKWGISVRRQVVDKSGAPVNAGPRYCSTAPL